MVSDKDRFIWINSVVKILLDPADVDEISRTIASTEKAFNKLSESEKADVFMFLLGKVIRLSYEKTT